MEKYLQASLVEAKRIPKSLLGDGMFIDASRGLVLPRVHNLSDEELVDIVSKIFPNLNQFSETFHKSWEVIKDTPQEELWSQAILHYFTTYGLESLGIDNEGFIYVPDEICETPELKKFRTIGIIDDEELSDLVVRNLESPMALKTSTINNYMEIIDHNDIDLDTDCIKNKDVRTLIQYKGKYLSKNGANLIRVIKYALTKDLTLVKSRELFQSIKNMYRIEDEDRAFIGIILEQRKRELASVFYRFKPVLLALRHQGFKKEINKIRRLANKYWRPLESQKFISTMILGNEEISDKDLTNLSIYDLVKIYNKLNYVIKSIDVLGVYYDVVVVRNGKIYVNETPKDLSKEQYAWAVVARDNILGIIKDRLSLNEVRGIIVPEGFSIAFPTSEKAFIGDIPLYTQIFTKASSVVGIAWEKEDLDLSALLSDGGKVGWNSHYSNNAKDVLYSGDMTRGGAEALFFNSCESALVMMNVYYGDIKEVNLFISNEKEFSLEPRQDGWGNRKCYLYDPNNIVYSVKLNIDGNSTALGVYDKQNSQTVFTFADLKVGDSNVSRNSELARIIIDVLKIRGESSLKLSDVYEAFSQSEFETKLEEESNFVEEADLEEWEETQRASVVDITSINKLDILFLAQDLPK